MGGARERAYAIDGEIRYSVVLDQHVEEEKDAEFVAMEEVDEVQSLEILTTMHDSEEIADIRKGSDSDLQSMPNDDPRSVLRFHTADSDDTHKNEVSKSNHIFQDDNASAKRLSLPDHMGHICKEVSSLHSRLADMESSIVQQVSAEFKSSLPALVTDSLKEKLPSLILDALKDTFPQLLKDSIMSSILKSILDELPHKELSKSLHKNMKKSIRLKGEQPSVQVVLNKKCMVVHSPEEKKEGFVSIMDDSDDDDPDKQPLSKRFKIMTPIPNLIPLNTFVPKHLSKPEEQQKSLHDFTNKLFGTTSLKFSQTLPREPTPPRDPAKGKEISIVK
uniref:Uncharacterized protein n=1 Tax=Tanacetum cinerariifolium TaxID=118510 RepID=A0A6L2LSX3_TANCI|nr:hypothetical protein [Tanacetum cinerariifolium]